MLPEIVIVGAQRSGTTTLFRLLSDHRQVVRPTMSKGVAFFDLNYDRGLEWYQGHFPMRLTAALRRGQLRRVTFESSGYYMFHPLAPERIAADLPNAKVVVMLRNPVDRAYSAHRHELRRGFETETFESAIALEADRTIGEMERLSANPEYQSFSLQHHAYLGRGEYAPQIKRLFATVGRENTYVVDSDRFFANQSTEFAKLCAWLELTVPRPSAEDAVWNAQPREPMSENLRTDLMLHFETFDKELQQLLGWTPSWRSGDVFGKPRD